MVYEAYNLTTMGNASGIVGLMQTVNSELMFNWFGVLTILTIFLISFIAFLVATGNNPRKSMSAACFIAFGLSMLLRILELVSDFVVIIALIATAISVAFIKD